MKKGRTDGSHYYFDNTGSYKKEEITASSCCWWWTNKRHLKGWERDRKTRDVVIRSSRKHNDGQSQQEPSLVDGEKES